MTNASQKQIEAANKTKAAKASPASQANVERVAKGLPQVASRPPKKVMSMFDILKARQGATSAPEPSTTNQVIPAATDKALNKVCPELISGLLLSDGTPHPGALIYRDPTGKFGPVGGLYIVRFVEVNKATAKAVLQKFGAANRTPTKAKLSRYTAHMDAGIGGDSGPAGWNFVFNSAIFTVDSAGDTVSVDLEQHNFGHSCNSLLACADPDAEILGLFCFGVPKSLRDSIDAQDRSAKDIASTRTELREMFAIGSRIGGLVEVKNDIMQSRLIGLVTQSIAVTNNIRNGETAKTGGPQGVDADVLDIYSDLVGKCVQAAFGMDMCSPWTGVAPKTGLPVKKTSGALTQIYAINHLAAAMALIAGYKLPDGTLCCDENLKREILGAYSILSDESQTDATEPMTSLRHQVLSWDANGQHKGATGMNVRFVALCKALELHLAGGRVTNAAWLKLLDSKSKRPDLNGYGSVHLLPLVDPETDEIFGYDVVEPVAIDASGIATYHEGSIEIYCGIDDYVNPADAAMAEAGSRVAAEADAALQEFLEEDANEVTEVAGDVPEDMDEDV